MKFNVILICLFVTVGHHAAQNVCKLTSAQVGLKNYYWAGFISRFGATPKRYSHPPLVCISQKKFFEIKSGSRINSVYDRNTDTVFLRTWSEAALRHELAHAYLERRYNGLPYPVSENLVNCMLTDQKASPSAVNEATQRELLLRQPNGRCIDVAQAHHVLRLEHAALLRLLK